MMRLLSPFFVNSLRDYLIVSFQSENFRNQKHFSLILNVFINYHIQPISLCISLFGTVILFFRFIYLSQS